MGVYRNYHGIFQLHQREPHQLSTTSQQIDRFVQQRDSQAGRNYPEVAIEQRKIKRRVLIA